MIGGLEPRRRRRRRRREASKLTAHNRRIKKIM